MVRKTKITLKMTLVIGLMFCLVFIYFFDNITGQYRFLQYCKNEGGLRVYEYLEKNVGWEANDYYDARSALQLEHVAFVRFRDTKTDNRIYDLYYIGDDIQSDASFKKEPIDESYSIKYVWGIDTFSVPGELRLKKTIYKAIDKKTEKFVATYSRFVYLQFDLNSSIFSAPSYVSCFKEEGRTFSDLNKIFKGN